MLENDEPTWYETKREGTCPVVYDTLRDAQIALLEDYQDALDHQLEEFANNKREFDDIDLNCIAYIEDCEVTDVITLNSGKTFKYY